MSAALRERAKAIFAETIDASAQDREAIVASACAGDARLRRVVDGLLAAHASAEAFLGAPTIGDEPGGETSAGAGDRSGEVIGRYRLLRTLGEGGFGKPTCDS